MNRHHSYVPIKLHKNTVMIRVNSDSFSAFLILTILLNKFQRTIFDDIHINILIYQLQNNKEFNESKDLTSLFEIRTIVVAEIIECDGNPCVNGTCADLIAAYSCECVRGFTGYNCSVGKVIIICFFKQRRRTLDNASNALWL